MPEAEPPFAIRLFRSRQTVSAVQFDGSRDCAVFILERLASEKGNCWRGDQKLLIDGRVVQRFEWVMDTDDGIKIVSHVYFDRSYEAEAGP